MNDAQPAGAAGGDPSYREMLFGPYAGPTWMLVVGVGLHAFAWFMVSTAVPGTVAELGGAPLVAWLTTAFEGASIVAGAAGGLTKRRIGARRALLAAAALFALGLLVAALAPRMEVVLLGRLLQGLGEGLVLALSYALIKDLFPERLVPRAFGLLAIVYAVAACIAPVVAGALTEWLSWRAAFLACLLPAGVLAVLVVRVLPRRLPGAPAEPAPLLRLAALAGAIFCFALTGNVEGAAVAGLALAALGLLIGALALDRRSSAPLLPRDAFRLGSAVGLVYWVVLLMPVSASGAYVFTPLFLVVLHDFGLTLAGYFFTLTALAWSAAALAVAGLQRAGAVRRAIAVGPALQCAGLVAVWAGFAGDVSTQVAAAVVAAGLIANGAGFGLCWAFLTQAVVRHSPAEESDQAAGLVPTVLTAGFALGAALAGLLANLGGIADPLTPDAAQAAAGPIFGGGAALALLSVAAALAAVRRIARLERAAGA
jgi:MFS family permease